MHGLPMKIVICVLALLYAACVPQNQMNQTVQGKQIKNDSPIVSISAGNFHNPGAIHVGQAFYLVDTSSRNCMILITIRSPPVITLIPCCSLMNVPEARKYLTWLNDSSCGQ